MCKSSKFEPLKLQYNQKSTTLLRKIHALDILSEQRKNMRVFWFFLRILMRIRSLEGSSFQPEGSARLIAVLILN